LNAVSKLKKSPLERLHYILGHDNMDKLQEGARGHLKASFRWLTKTKPENRSSLLREQLFPDSARVGLKEMFRFVALGEMDVRKIERAHKQERLALGGLQSAALSEERRSIRADASRARADARTDHKAELKEIKRSHAEEREKAEKALKFAKELNERTGVDRRDAKTRSMTEQSLSDWGFARQGFDQQGFGRDREDREREDERERFIKPPGASFTP
jgi:oligoendopeptidase F